MATQRQSPKNHISNLISARYGAISIVSSEEYRVMNTLHDIASESKELFSWDSTRGLQVIEKNKNTGEIVIAMNDEGTDYKAASDYGIDTDAMRNPMNCMEEILNWRARHPNSKDAIFVMKDLATLMMTNAGEYRIPEYARAIRNIAQECISSPSTTFILLNPSFKLPSELEKDVTVYEFPLPSREELGAVLDDALLNVPNKVRKDLNGTREVLIDSLSGLTLLEAENVLSMAIVSTGKLDVSAIDFILEEKAQIIKKSGIAEFIRANVKDGDIGGLDNLSTYTRKRRAAFSSKARAFGLSAPRGVLVVGFPGSGKSLSAKASTGGTMPLLRVDIGALMGQFLGNSEENMRKVLRLADAIAPCVLWFDEIEKGLAGMTGGLSGNDSGRRMFGTLLTWMQEHESPVYCFATSNDIGGIASSAPELLRRFDALFYVDLPTEAERESIIKIHISKKSREPKNFDTAEIAKSFDQFTGGEIEKAVEYALVTAFEDGEREMTTEDILSAKSFIVPVARTMKRGVEDMRSEWVSMGCLPASTPKAKQPETVVEGGRRRLKVE